MKPLMTLACMALAATTLTACSDDVGSPEWCNAQRAKPKTEWTGQNTSDFVQHCIAQNEIGSPTWCEDMDIKPKGDWSLNEATGYAQHCLF